MSSSQNPSERPQRPWLAIRSPRSLAERFWEKVEKTDNCWLWRGAITGRGYGAIGEGGKGGRLLGVHRVALMLAGVVFDDSAYICHTCDVRACVRPDHLYVGSALTNNRDTLARSPRPGPRLAESRERSRQARLRFYRDHPDALPTHCPKGHPYPPFVPGSGRRRCIPCGRIRALAGYYRRKAAQS